MHTIRLFKARKAAIILAAAFSLCTLFSLVHLLDNSTTGLKLVRRDGSSITFSLPWKSVTPVADTASKPVSTSLDKYLDGITNVAVALQNGGILIGDNTRGADAQNLAAKINGVNVTASDLEKGNITAQLPSIIARPPASNSHSTSSTPTPMALSDDDMHEHNDDCGCTLDNSGIHNNNTGSATGLLSMSATSLPLTFSCAGPATITETWHRTQYAETTTFFSFLSVFTVTETASGCHTSSPNPINMIQCVQGIFVKDKIECGPTMMNGSPAPGSNNPPDAPSGVKACTKCLKQCTCSSHQTTTCPTPSSLVASQSMPSLSIQESFAVSISALCASSTITTSESSRSSTTALSTSNAQVSSNSTTTAKSTNTTASTSIARNSPMVMTTTATQNPESSSQSNSISTSSTTPAVSISFLSLTSSIGKQASSTSGTQAISLTSSQATSIASTQTTSLPALVDYGSKVLEGATLGVNEALASVSGLTGDLLSTVLAEVNAALAEALSTARPLTRVLPSTLSDAVTPRSTPITSFPVPTNAVGNAANVLSSLLSKEPLAPTGLTSSAVSLATQLGTALQSDATQAVWSVLGAVSGVIAPANAVVGGVIPASIQVLDTVPTNAVGNVAAILNPILPLVSSLNNSGLSAFPPALSVAQPLANSLAQGVVVTSAVPVATAVNAVVQAGAGVVGAQVVGAIPARPLVGNLE